MATRLIIRCTDEEKATWEKRAELAGVSVSDWVRGRLNVSASVTAELRGVNPTKRGVKFGGSLDLITCNPDPKPLKDPKRGGKRK